MFQVIFKYAVPFEGIAGYGRMWLVSLYGTRGRDVIVVENSDLAEGEGNFILREVRP